MRFDLHILGANSAVPLPGRFPTSLILNYNDSLTLIDCGEGAQIKMSQFGIKRSKIERVYISHLHGDHIFGLPGFLHSLNLSDRNRPLKLYGPIGLKSYIESNIELTQASFGYDMQITELGQKEYRLVDNFGDLDVYCFPLKHRIETFGYKFVEHRREYNIRPEAIARFGLSHDDIRTAKSGQDLVRDNEIIAHSDLCYENPNPRCFVYCSDTIYDPELIQIIDGCDLLYHEATYTHDLVDKAQNRMHSTAKEAAQIAKSSGVRRLVIGHYSSRYTDLSVLLDEARLVFPNTFLAEEGEVFEIPKKPRLN